MDKLHWEVSSLVIRNGTYFGYGWLFHEEKAIRDIRLKVIFLDGESESIVASIEKSRKDVSANFPNFVTAEHSGFFLLGCCYKQQDSSNGLFLLVTFVDGFVAELNVPRSCIKNIGKDNVVPKGISFPQFVERVKRNLYLFRDLKIASVVAKIRGYLGDKPLPCLVKGQDVLKILDTSELHNIVLIIDHDLGGGANHYRERLVTEKIGERATVLVLSCAIETLSYVLIVRSKRRSDRFVIPGYSFLLELAEQIQIKELIYNTGVSFMRPEELPRLITKLKINYDLHLTLLVHDFFMVCPSHFLIDDTGNYCDIPEIKRCQTCLVHNQQDFSSLYVLRNIIEWRALWGAVISHADELRTFSDNSLRLIRRAYPILDLSKAVVMPHKISYLKHTRIKPSNTSSLSIGVVGHIGHHKGAKIVRELASEIKTRGLNVPIVVIGTIEVQCEPAILSETGPYTHEELQQLIEDSGVNIILFPSIWPETFSYVVHELIEFEMPVACFDLGAAAERLRDYEKGLIMSETIPSAILDSLISFHKRIYLSS